MCDYSRLIVVTNRKLCRGDYLAQLDKVLRLGPDSLILREKDLEDNEYAELAAKVSTMCHEKGVPFFIHSHAALAAEIKCRRIHLSLESLKKLTEESMDRIAGFDEISVSCHSLTDAEEAIALGATRIVLGNIFETDCKKGLPGKGLEFLQKVSESCAKAEVPVYAIGGISPENLSEVLGTGAAGGCMMSGFMRL